MKAKKRRNRFALFLCLGILTISVPTKAQTDTDPLSKWLAAIESNDSSAIDSVCFLPPAITYDLTNLNKLLNHLNNREAFVKINIIYALLKFKSFPDSTIPKLIELLKDSLPNVRNEAAVALIGFGEDAIDPLLKIIIDDTVSERNRYRYVHLYNRSTVQLALAHSALAQIGMPVLKHISPGAKPALSSLKRKIIDQLTEPEQAEYYDVQDIYQQLQRTFWDTTWSLIPILDSILSNKFLSKAFFKWVNDDSNKEKAERVLLHLLSQASSKQTAELIKGLSGRTLTSSGIFNKILFLSSDIQYEAFNRIRFYDKITIDSLGMARLMALLYDPASVYQVINMLPNISVPANFRFSGFDYKEVIRLTNSGLNDVRKSAYQTLINWNKPELLPNIYNGIFDHNEHTRYICLQFFHEKYRNEKIFVSALCEFLFGRKAHYYYVRDAFTMIEDLDSSGQSAVYYSIDGLLRDSDRLDSLYYYRDEFLTSAFTFYLRQGDRGAEKLKFYSKKKEYRSFIIKAFKNITLEDNDIRYGLLFEFMNEKDKHLERDIYDYLPSLKWNANTKRVVSIMLKKFEKTRYEYDRDEIMQGLINIADSVNYFLTLNIEKSKYPNEILSAVAGTSCTDQLENNLIDKYLYAGKPAVRHASYKHVTLCNKHLTKHHALLKPALEDPNENPLIKEEILDYIIEKNDTLLYSSVIEFIRQGNSPYYITKAIDFITSKSVSNDSSLIKSLLMAAEHTNRDVCVSALKGLGIVDSGSFEVVNILREHLFSDDSELSYTAAQSLINFKLPPDKTGRYIYYVLSNNFSNRLCEEDRFNYGKIGGITSLPMSMSPTIKYSRLFLSDELYGIYAKDIPVLPWPPPPATCRDVIPDRYFRYASTLGDISSTLLNALYKCGYRDTKLFGLAKGFAILTKLERITDSGEPSQRERWSTYKLSPLSLSDYISSLLWGSEGKFRVILFIITPFPNFLDDGKPLLTTNYAARLFARGGSILTPEIAKDSFRGKYIHALIYEFHKKNTGEANILPPGQTTLSTMGQLEATNIFNYLYH